MPSRRSPFRSRKPDCIIRRSAALRSPWYSRSSVISREHRVGVELEADLGAVPPRVAEPSGHGRRLPPAWRGTPRRAVVSGRGADEIRVASRKMPQVRWRIPAVIFIFCALAVGLTGCGFRRQPRGERGRNRRCARRGAEDRGSGLGAAQQLLPTRLRAGVGGRSAKRAPTSPRWGFPSRPASPPRREASSTPRRSRPTPAHRGSPVPMARSPHRTLSSRPTPLSRQALRALEDARVHDVRRAEHDRLPRQRAHRDRGHVGARGGRQRRRQHLDRVNLDLPGPGQNEDFVADFTVVQVDRAMLALWFANPALPPCRRTRMPSWTRSWRVSPRCRTKHR